MATPPEEKGKISRRKFILTTAGTAIVAALAGFAGGYLSAPGKVIKEIVEVPVKPPKKEVPKEPIYVTQAGFETGAGVLWSKQNTDMLKAMIDYINETGGILGRKLVLQTFDATIGKEQTIDWLTKLASEHKADVFFSNAGSGYAMALAPTIEERKIIAFTQGTYTIHLFEDAIPGAKYFFRVSPHDGGWILAPAYEVARKYRGKKLRLALLFQDYAPGRDCGMIAKEALMRLHGDVEIVYEAYHPLYLTDFTPYISAILASKPDVLFAGDWGGDTKTKIEQFTAYGVYEKIPLIVHTWDIHLVNEFGRRYPTNVLGASSNYNITCPGLGWPLSKWLFDFTRTRLGMYPTYNMCETYIGVMAYKYGVELAYGLKGEYPEPEDIAKALWTLVFPYPGPGGYAGFRRDSIGIESTTPAVVGYSKIHPEYGIAVLDPVWTVPPEMWGPPPGVKVMEWIRTLKPLP